MRGEEVPLYKISKACEILGVKPGILRQWDTLGLIKTIRTPGGMRLFDISNMDPKTKLTHKPVLSSTILYSRVSSEEQKPDLEKQQAYLKSHIPEKFKAFTTTEISDIGSGINLKRSGLLQLLGLVKQGLVSVVIVSSKDRLARFGFELIEWMCGEYGTQIVILDTDDSTAESQSQSESEFGNDLMEIVKVYSKSMKTNKNR